MKLTDLQFKSIGDVVDTRNLTHWVVVREYTTVPTGPSHLQTILTNFKIPKEARILPQDVRIENYRGSKIVDLSNALTAPSPEWSDFLFGFFYEETVQGFFDWFKGGKQTSTCQAHDHLFAGPLPLPFSPDVPGPEGGTGARVLPGTCCN